MGSPFRPQITLSVDYVPRNHRPARDRGLSPTTSQQLVDSYLQGATIRGLARDLRMHRTTIDNCLKRAGVKQRRQPALTPSQLDEAEAAYRAGDSWITIAQRYGVDPGTVGRGLKLRGGKMRPRRGGIGNPTHKDR